MFRKVSKLSFTFMFVTLLLFASTTVFAAQPNINTKRLSGANRYATSSAVALSKWTQCDYAILAFGEDFPDALSAAPLAKKYNAPILLTETNTIPEETLNTIKQLKVKNVIIIGGTGIISSAVQDKLNSMGITTSRIFGQDRYETSIKIAEQLDNVTEIALVTGENFADALSISPVAVKKNMPIILVRFNKIPDVVLNYISSHKLSKIYVITTAGVPFDGTVLNNNSNSDLIIGNDKYQINMNIIEKFRSDLDLSTVYLATGENFADALSGSILAGSNSNPLILVGNDLSSVKTFFDNNSGAISNIKILGGIGSVSEEIIKELTGSSTNSSPSIDSTVSKIEFVSTDLTKTGSNTATFKYRVLNQNGIDITQMVSASEFDAVSSVNSSISLDPSTGTGTIVIKSSIRSDGFIVVTLIDKVAGKVGMLNGTFLASDPINSSNPINSNDPLLTVSKVEFISNNLTRTGTNTATFKYRILDKNGTDLTKTIPASQITATITANGTIALDPSTGTGTINCTSSSDIDKAIVVTLIDKETEVKATAQFDLRSATQKVSKIVLNSTQLIVDDEGSGVANYKVLDQYGDDITFSDLAANITFNSDVGKVEIIAKGAFKITPNPGIDIRKLTTVTITGKDANSGVSMSGTLTIPQ